MTSKKGLLIIDVESCDVENEDVRQKLSGLILSFDKSEENALIIQDILEVAIYKTYIY